MKKKINIVRYDDSWPQIFQDFSKEIKNILQENCINIYHVGSTSVPELCAKPVVDMMCVVKDLRVTEEKLKQVGYESKGEFNLPLRLFFSKKHPYDVHIHVVKENSGEISWNLTFRNYLRENKTARDEYAKVKLDLVKENPDGFNMIEGLFSEYTIKKGETIRKIAEKAGFRDYRFVIATNHYEIESYKKLMGLNNTNFNNKNIFHLCLYKGVEIVAGACVEFDIPSSTAIINSIKSIDVKNKEVLMDKINEWVSFHNLTLIK